MTMMIIIMILIDDDDDDDDSDDNDDDGDNNGLVDTRMSQFSFVIRSNFISGYLWTWSHMII